MTGRSMIMHGFCTKYIANDEEVGTLVETAVTSVMEQGDSHFGVGNWRPIQIDHSLVLKTESQLTYGFASVLIIGEQVS